MTTQQVQQTRRVQPRLPVPRTPQLLQAPQVLQAQLERSPAVVQSGSVQLQRTVLARTELPEHPP